MLHNKVKETVEHFKDTLGATLNMHSGCGKWASVVIDQYKHDIHTIMIEIELTDNGIEVEASYMINFSMLRITTGTFTYPNGAFDRQLQKMKEILAYIPVEKI